MFYLIARYVGVKHYCGLIMVYCSIVPARPSATFALFLACFTGLSVFLPGTLKIWGESPECSAKKINKKKAGYEDPKKL